MCTMDILTKITLNMCFLALVSHSTNCNSCLEAEMPENVLQREKRQILFPNTTLLQLNIGMSALPGDIKTFSYNWAFQANFQLPWNRTQIPTDIFFANTAYDGDSRSERDKRNVEDDIADRHTSYENDAKLHHFYQYVEGILDSMGYNGTGCVLKTLCQISEEPLHSHDEEDLLHELVSFVLNPNNEVTQQDQPPHPDATRYISAYNRSDRRRNCHKEYNCELSLLDMFTKLHSF